MLSNTMQGEPSESTLAAERGTLSLASRVASPATVIFDRSMASPGCAASYSFKWRSICSRSARARALLKGPAFGSPRTA
ncbi:MAG TPA: hypothetical protein VG796_00095 [Verrucomicrobiales bacterium]|nr:hypothetical protein [Verrucomicrobiales bacterium]